MKGNRLEAEDFRKFPPTDETVPGTEMTHANTVRPIYILKHDVAREWCQNLEYIQIKSNNVGK